MQRLNTEYLLLSQMLLLTHLSDGNSGATQRLNFDGSTTTKLGLFKAYGSGERNKGRKEENHTRSRMFWCMSPKTHVLKACSPGQHCPEMVLFRSDWIMQPSISQWINPVMGGFNRLLGDNGNLRDKTQLKQWTINVIPLRDYTWLPFLSHCFYFTTMKKGASSAT